MQRRHHAGQSKAGNSKILNTTCIECDMSAILTCCTPSRQLAYLLVVQPTIGLQSGACSLQDSAQQTRHCSCCLAPCPVSKNVHYTKLCILHTLHSRKPSEGLAPCLLRSAAATFISIHQRIQLHPLASNPDRQETARPAEYFRFAEREAAHLAYCALQRLPPRPPVHLAVPTRPQCRPSQAGKRLARTAWRAGAGVRACCAGARFHAPLAPAHTPVQSPSGPPPTASAAHRSYGQNVSLREIIIRSDTRPSVTLCGVCNNTFQYDAAVLKHVGSQAPAGYLQQLCTCPKLVLSSAGTTVHCHSWCTACGCFRARLSALVQLLPAEVVPKLVRAEQQCTHHVWCMHTQYLL